jgi:UBA-like domain
MLSVTALKNCKLLNLSFFLTCTMAPLDARKQEVGAVIYVVCYIEFVPASMPFCSAKISWCVSHRCSMRCPLQLVDQFKDFTHSADDAQATQMLEWHGWSLDRAVVSELILSCTERYHSAVQSTLIAQRSSRSMLITTSVMWLRTLMLISLQTLIQVSDAAS